MAPQIQSTLLLVGTVAVVLDEDGTMVETEEFFQTLEDGTVLMALGKGQTWASAKVSMGVAALASTGYFSLPPTGYGALGWAPPAP